MGALGDYIHLYYSHYKSHGIAHINETPSFANYALNVIERRINDEVKDIKLKTVQELEKRLKLNSNSQLQKSQKKWVSSQQKLIDQIYVLLFERSQNISGASRLYDIAKGDYWRTDSDGKRTHILGEQHWAASKSREELYSIKTKAQSLYTQIQKLIDKINNQNSAQSSQNLEKLEKLYQQYTHLTYDSNDHTLAAIEKAIGENRYSGIATQIGGNFGEMFVAVCDDEIFKQANKSVAQAVQESVKGAERTEVLIDKELIADNKMNKILKTSTKDKTKYTLGVTQNKVDVQIQINNEDLFASVKSYTGLDKKSSRPDLQDVNLFTSLVFLNEYQGLKDIGNHWLNIHTTHPGKARNSVNENSQLEEIIKKEIAFQALSSGNPFKQGTNRANVFVFINRSTGQVYTKSVKDILFNNFSKIGGLDRISRVYLENRKGKDFQDRITNVLNQLHQQVISVALNIKFD